MAKEIMLGNEAIARGAYEAGVKVSSAYPGTPSTEISESLQRYTDDIYSEWAPNEKVAVEVAMGASIAGVRSMAAMKHVGLNVAADPLYTASYIGATGGIVIVVADDPGMYSSQNEQDTRRIGIASKVPVIEPADSQEAKDFTKIAFDISEEYDTPVIVRTTTRLSHSQGLVQLEERQEREVIEYKKNPRKNVMVPANAKLRHPIVEENMARLAEDACSMEDLNKVEMGDTSIGFITSGIPYQYIKEVMPEASVLKLGMVHPLPRKLIEDFASQVDRLIIFEELEPVIEEQAKSWGIECEGKDLFPRIGEYSSEMLLEVFTDETTDVDQAYEAPARPPVLCPGCPHRAVFSVMKKLRLHGAGDIGCYTLGAGSPQAVIDTAICMGASISSLHGMEKARGHEYIKDWVAVIGDSTFFHTGVNSLINMVYNESWGTVLILDNSTTAMTGHQDNPATGTTLRGDISNAISFQEICEGIGVDHYQEVSSFDLDGLTAALKEARDYEGVSVVVANSPCALLKTTVQTEEYWVEEDKCRACGICTRPGCPAITQREDDKIAVIDQTQCTGCSLCAELCPFDAIACKELIRR